MEFKQGSDAHVYSASGVTAAPLWVIRAFGPNRVVGIYVPRNCSGFPKAGLTACSPCFLTLTSSGRDTQPLSGQFLRPGAIFARNTSKWKCHFANIVTGRLANITCCLLKARATGQHTPGYTGKLGGQGHNCLVFSTPFHKLLYPALKMAAKGGVTEHDRA